MRAFISAEIPDWLKEQILKVQRDLTKTGADLKLVKSENLHLTLRFLGDISEDTARKIGSTIKDICKDYSTFNLSFEKLGVFPNEKFMRVIWVGISEGKQEIISLNEKIEAEIKKENVMEKSEYIPHLTIARIKSIKNSGKLKEVINKLKDVTIGSFPVTEIKLIQSELTPEGPIYTILEKADLKNG